MSLTTFLTNIANALRKKNGTTDPINAQDFVSEIEKPRAIDAAVINRTVTHLDDWFFSRYPVLHYAEFEGCLELQRVVIPDYVTLKNKDTHNVFRNAFSWVSDSSIIDRECYVGTGITYLTQNFFYANASITKIVFRGNITEIMNAAFLGAGKSSRKNTTVDIIFSNNTVVPAIPNTTIFANTEMSWTVNLVIPDALYDEWINATNWSAISINYIKLSEYLANGGTLE